ncbi:MAG: hypothetical protein HY917_03830 [Candidatus Diapherotrites archaeon]|nr:hypothetical protein [Candidatus Diapherotrites archaeon]
MPDEPTASVEDVFQCNFNVNFNSFIVDNIDHRIIEKIKEQERKTDWYYIEHRVNAKYVSTPFTPEACWLLEFRERTFPQIRDKKLTNENLNELLIELYPFYSKQYFRSLKEGNVTLVNRFKDFFKSLDYRLKTNRFSAQLNNEEKKVDTKVGIGTCPLCNNTQWDKINIKSKDTEFLCAVCGNKWTSKNYPPLKVTLRVFVNNQESKEQMSIVEKVSEDGRITVLQKELETNVKGESSLNLHKGKYKISLKTNKIFDQTNWINVEQSGIIEIRFYPKGILEKINSLIKLQKTVFSEPVFRKMPLKKTTQGNPTKTLK